MRINTTSTRLQLESLENRWTPSGNVTAQLVDPIGSGTPYVLLIEGDNEGNEIRVTHDEPGHARIEGLGSTTVNGMAAAEISDHFVWVDVRLGNGRDSLVDEFTDDRVWDIYTQIDSGNGDDSVQVTVRGRIGLLSIDTGFGNDSVVVDLAQTSWLLSALDVQTGLGDDSVLVRTNSHGVSGPIIFGPGSQIDTDSGNDLVQFDGSLWTMYSFFFVNLGSGDDTLIGDATSTNSRIVASGGTGNDTVLNAAYFGGAPWYRYFLASFESVQE